MASKVPETEFVWRNGRLIKWADATIHVMSHVVGYGSAVFEGIRVYMTPRGPAIFRLKDHLRRLYDSAKIYRMDIPYGQGEVEQACAITVARNRLGACYLKPIALRGYGSIGIDGVGAPVEVFVFTYPWGTYLGENALRDGVDCCVSTWNRPAPNTFPTMAKATGNYLNAQLMRMEARVNGYAEAIALDTNGVVSEGSGENLFLVRDRTIFTTPLTNAILPGITRDTIVSLARARGYTVVEAEMQREALYIADEVFVCGTAAEVTPVRSLDRIPVAQGKPGPITMEIQQAYFDLVQGKAPDPRGWLYPVVVD